MGWALAVMVFAVLAPVIGWWLRIPLALPPHKSLRGAFATSGDQGNFGELLTAAALTATGWRQLPSKLGGGGHGIDGLFVRPGLLGFRVLIVETKTNTSPYKPRQLADATLIRTIGELYLIGQIDRPLADALVRALKRRAPGLRKECWRHRLADGVTEIRRARRDGKLRARARKRDLSCLSESLATMLAAFDHEGLYTRMRSETATAQTIKYV